MKSNVRRMCWLYSILCLAMALATSSKAQANTEDFVAYRMTPQPSVVPGLTQRQINLNGPWDFLPEPPKDFFDPAQTSDKSWCRIDVPGEWVMQGFTVPEGKAAGYKRTFHIPRSWQGKRIKLRCEAVYSLATVWVNGVRMGEHLGGFTAFELDITKAAHIGQENIIALAVQSDSVADKIAKGSSYASHALGGISRPISVFAVPQTYVRAWQIRTSFDADYQDVTLHLKVALDRNGDVRPAPVTLNLKLAGPDHESVALAPSNLRFTGEASLQEVSIPMTRPRKWDCDHPNLYTLVASVQVNGRTVETLQERFGFRDCKVVGTELLVNGRPVKLRGVCRHEVHPLRGRSLTPEVWRRDAEMIKAMNCNFVRTSHYPPADAFLKHCDELGLFVELEAPICWEREYDPNVVEAYLQGTHETVAQGYNHPSVIFWSLANESTWNQGFTNTHNLVRKLDPYRPVIFHSGHLSNDDPLCDLTNVHYPGLGGPQDHASVTRPVLFGEYCHLGRINRQEKITDPGLRDYFGFDFAEMWDRMYNSKNVVGGAIWCGTDEVFFFDGKEHGYGYWGPIDGWRREKPEYWNIKKSYSPIRIRQKFVDMPAPGQRVTVDVENRFDFANLNEMDCRWRCGAQSGFLSPDIPARSTGTLTIPVTRQDLTEKEIELTFCDPTGLLVDRFRLAVGPPVRPALTLAPKTQPLTLTNTDTRLIIAGDNFAWEIDKKTAMLLQGRFGEQPVVIGGPYLDVTPFKEGTAKLTGEALPPYNVFATQWRATNVTTVQENEVVTITVSGTFDVGEGTFTYRFNRQGQMILLYDFTYNKEEKMREIGLGFDVAKSFDRLLWQRNAQWTTYPAGHIGRPMGQARPYRDASWPAAVKFRRPVWPWAMDGTEQGINDFRGTKRNIYWSSLTDDQGIGVFVHADGTQHHRCYVNGDSIRSLVTDYCGAGNRRRASSMFREIKPGDRLTGTVTLELGV